MTKARENFVGKWDEGNEWREVDRMLYPEASLVSRGADEGGLHTDSG